MRVQFLGSGDAFGSGGRFNTCFHVTGSGANFLIDCGASSLIAMKRFGVERAAIDTILITHFHADHFAGVPFFVLDGHFVARRERPLLIAGPPGLRERYVQAMENAFRGFIRLQCNYPLELVELPAARPTALGPLEVTPLPVRHGPPEETCYGFRIAVGGKTIAFSGDTEWTDNLIELGRDADLMICESYTYDKPAPLHLAYTTLAAKLPAIRPKRIVLTHMNEEMLARRAGIPEETADDGLVVEI